MSELRYTVNGVEYTADQLKAMAPGRKAATKDAPESFHKGFRVEGHPPGAMEQAKQDAIDTFERYQALDDEGRKQWIGKPPHPWNETNWRMNAKKKPVRPKPYELKEAADLCANMALKAGWLDVVVVALVKEAAT